MAITMKQINELLPALIQGARLRLVPFADKHLNETYVSWLNNTDVVRYSNQRFMQHSRESCRQYLDSFEGTSNRFYAIEDFSTGKLIGSLTMYINLQHKTADVGILIGAIDHWGTGYGHEAFSLALDALLASVSLRKVTAGTMACNAGMIKVMMKCGMHLEATRKDQELLNGEPVDILYFAKFSSQ
jgi:RimJ/RimL family protein N-acetyltransferase